MSGPLSPHPSPTGGEGSVFRVREPLRHDGVDHDPGDVVTLGPATATALVAAGVITTLPPASPAEAGAGGEELATTAPRLATARAASGKGAAGRRVAPTPA